MSADGTLVAESGAERMAVAFARLLRGVDIAAPLDSVLTFVDALSLVGLDDRGAVYWAARATLVRRPEDIQRMADRQLRLLSALWPLLTPGGVMVYATCSVLAAEGEDVAKRFLMSQPDAKHDAITDVGWGEARRHGRRIAPGGGFDGFYYVRFRKPARREV